MTSKNLTLLKKLAKMMNDKKKVSRRKSRKSRKVSRRKSRKSRKVSKRKSRKSKKVSRRKSKKVSKRKSDKSDKSDNFLLEDLSSSECKNLAYSGKTESQRKKYAERPGPPFPANAKDCRGTIRIGNDGAAYESVANSNGVYRWKNIDK